MARNHKAQQCFMHCVEVKRKGDRRYHKVVSQASEF